MYKDRYLEYSVTNKSYIYISMCDQTMIERKHMFHEVDDCTIFLYCSQFNSGLFVCSICLF